MDKQQAKEILRTHRPGRDEADPRVAAALELARRDPDLARWLEAQRAFHDTVRARLEQIAVPAGLKEKILAGQGAPARKIIRLKPPVAIAAAAAIMFLVGLSYYLTRPSPPAHFDKYVVRMAGAVTRDYRMDILSTNLTEIREYLSGQQAPADYQLSDKLEQTPAIGCAAPTWQGEPVSLLCFDAGGTNRVWLFVAERTDVPGAPAAMKPQFQRVGRLVTASWSDGKLFYMAASFGDESFLRKYL